MTTTYNPRTPGSGLVRAADGILEWHGGRHYNTPEPNEAVKSYRSGVMAVRCNESVSSTWSSGPCGKTAKFDADKNGHLTKCGHHSAEAMAKKDAKKKATYSRWKAEWAARDAIHNAEAQIEAALQRIADGHNDPRSLAQETLQKVKEAREAMAKLKS